MATDPFICHPRLFDAGTLTNGNELASLPATNLQTMQPSKRWRTSGVANVWIQVDFGAATALDLVALISHNALAPDTWRIRASADSTPTTSPDYDSGSLNLFPGGVRPTESWRDHYDSFKILPSTQTWRYWRIDVTCSASYFEAGRVVLDLRQSLKIQWGIGFGTEPADIVDKSPMGGANTEARGRPRTMEFDVDLQQTDAQGVYAIDMMRGLAQD